MVSGTRFRCGASAIAVALVLLLAATAAAQGVGTVSTRIVLGSPPVLEVDLRYQDPAALFPRLSGTLVFPVWVTARNVSMEPTTLGIQDLRLTIGSISGSTADLRPIDAKEAQQRLRNDSRMNEVLRWITSSPWAPDPFDRPLTNLQLRPGQSRSGYVFFLRPAGFEFDGFMTVATSGHAAELLPNNLIRSSPSTRSDQGLMERFTKALGIRDLVYGRPFGKSYALLFGISTYDDAGKNLPGPLNDVRRMEDYLNAQGFDRVVVLTDRAVTESALRHVQAHFDDTIRPEDRLLVYYAGHGRKSQAGDADLVLSTGARVPMKRFMDWIGSVKVKHLLVLLDACYSGSVIPGYERDVLDRLDASTGEKVYALARQGSRFVITAGDANELAHEDVARWGGGLFTTAVLRALRPPSKKITIVTTYDLYSRVKGYVVDEVQKHGLTAQIPRIRDLGYGGDGKTAPPPSVGEFVFVGG
jgi:Caspase domain